MSKLKWHETGTREYETGVSKGVLYTISSEGVYDVGVAWNGLSAVTESPSGAEETPIYADNIKYLSLRSVEEFGATVEAYTYPDEWEECDGSAQIVPGVTIGQQKRKKFGLSYVTVLGNDVENEEYGYKIHLIYGATASPSERAYQTINESPEALTFSWEMTTTPVDVGTIGGKTYKSTACLTIDSTKIEATKLQTLEDILYGTDGEPETIARLPLPDEIYTLLSE